MLALTVIEPALIVHAVGITTNNADMAMAEVGLAVTFFGLETKVFLVSRGRACTQAVGDESAGPGDDR